MEDLPGAAPARACLGIPGGVDPGVDKATPELGRLQPGTFVARYQWHSLCGSGHRGGRWRACVISCSVGGSHSIVGGSLPPCAPYPYGRCIFLRGRHCWRAHTVGRNAPPKSSYSTITNTFGRRYWDDGPPRSASFCALLRPRYQPSLFWRRQRLRDLRGGFKLVVPATCRRIHPEREASGRNLQHVRCRRLLFMGTRPATP